MADDDSPPRTRSYGAPPPGHRLPDAARPGRIRLQVADGTRALRFYRDLLGFEARQTGGGIVLAAHGGPGLIELHERPGAGRPPPGGRPGLFHVAVLLPERAALGRLLAHLRAAGVQPGAADHGVSEALYLTDPDGLGLEIYADRPRSTWRVRGRELDLVTEPLDAADLVEAGGRARWEGVPDGASIGHVHLHVGDLERARRFYHDGLGLDRVVWSYPGALFLSAGGYHHHLGLNTWARNDAPAPEDEARMLDWRLLLPDETSLRAAADALREREHAPIGNASGRRFADPWGNVVELAIDAPGA